MEQINVFENYSSSSGATTLQIIIDMLRFCDYEIAHEATTNTRNINYAIAAKDIQNLPQSVYSDVSRNSKTTNGVHSRTEPRAAPEASIYLYDGDELTTEEGRRKDNTETLACAYSLNLPAIITCANQQSLDSLVKAIDSSKELSAQITLIRSRNSDSHPLLKLLNLVSNLIISVNEFTAACTHAMQNADTLQRIVDVADNYFGLFISIIDVNGVLLAYTASSKPEDEINRGLIEKGYLDKKPESENDLNNGYLPGRIMSRQGTQICTAPYMDSMSLITYTIRIRGQYYANITMECPGEKLTQGLIDAFDIFAGYCKRLSMIISQASPTQDFGAANFMITLLTEEKLDPAFLFDQAKKLSIPTTGYFILLSFSVDFGFRDQLELFAHEVDTYLRIPHRTFVHNSSIYALIYGDDYKSVAGEFNRLYDFSFKYSEHLMYSSDIYLSLADTYLAGREITAIEKYRKFIERVRIYTKSKKKPNVFVFLDAFSFYWSDPVADNEIRAFSIDRTLINTIDKDDRLNGTDHLSLLNAYIINDCKTAAIADRFHMHRNGIRYRIDKIAKMYDLDLSDFITRQYLQVSARVQMVASDNFIQLKNLVGMPDKEQKTNDP